MKRCPDCAELVQPDARVCRYCRFDFEAGGGAPPQRVEQEKWEKEKATSTKGKVVLLGAAVLLFLITIAYAWPSKDTPTYDSPPAAAASEPDTSVSELDAGKLRAIQAVACPESSEDEIAGYAQTAADTTASLTAGNVIDLVLAEDYNGQSCVQAFALAVSFAEPAP